MVAALAGGHAQNAYSWIHQRARLRQGLLGARDLRVAQGARLRRGYRVVAVVEATDSVVGRAHEREGRAAPSLALNSLNTSTAGLATPWLTPAASMPPAKKRPTGSAFFVPTTSDPESPASLNWLPLDGQLVGVGLGQ